MVHQMLKHNIDIKGKFLNKEEYPDLPEQFFTEYTEQEIKEVNEQYIPAFSPVFYNEDKEILFIDAHY